MGLGEERLLQEPEAAESREQEGPCANGVCWGSGVSHLLRISIRAGRTSELFLGESQPREKKSTLSFFSSLFEATPGSAGVAQALPSCSCPSRSSLLGWRGRSNTSVCFDKC